MDRCALFVDAGYVLADGAMAVHGTRRRESVSWDYAGLLQLLGNLAMERSRLPLLRCYWYEATVEGRRSADHDTLADLPGVKLRVAKMRPGRREGVEGEIHRDLTTLARNKAVSDAMVVSAEEDLAQVIADVQDMGMRVTLLQVTGDGSMAVSRALRQECDDIADISAAHLRPYVELISGAEPPRSDEADAPLALRPAMNGTLNGTVGNGSVNSGTVNNGNVNGNGSGPSAAGQNPAYAQPQGRPSAGPRVPASASPYARPAAAAADYQQVSEVPPGSDQPGGAVPQPMRADASLADHGEPEPADYGAVDHGTAADYGPAPADYGAAVSTVDYGTGVDYSSYPDYAAPVQSPVPGAAREELYAAPVPVSAPGDDLPGERERLSARTRQGAEPSAYNPGAVREQYQRDGLLRDTGDGGDRLQPVPIAVPAGSGQVRRLPTRGTGPGGPSQGRPPLSLPAAPPAPMPASPAGPDTAFSQQPGGQQQGGQQLGGQQQGGHVPGGPAQVGPPTGGQPAAPVLPMESNGTPYPGGRGGSFGAPRQVIPGPGAPGGAGGFGGPSAPPALPSHLPPVTGPGGPMGQPGSGVQPALSPVPAGLSGSQPPPPTPGNPGNPGVPGGQGSSQAGQGGQGGQPDVGAPSGPLGLVGPGYSGGQSGVSLGDAVQSAHEEGQAFGESVARDAPALWLEAVLARKPRMPSDLEARLLQGSALPIDFLLHDEVRHALRRGFWDALERARR